MSKALILLATMEGLTSELNINQSRMVTQIHIVRQGGLNKVCLGCGHKNKKCTCVSTEVKE